jgi:hypothetical protein
MKKIIFVVSMHRSDSSLLTKALECCGVHLGSHLRAPSKDNPKGYFEDMDFSLLNDEILTHTDHQWSLITTRQTTLGQAQWDIFSKKAIYLLKKT